MGRDKKSKKGVMYSTNPDFEYEYENNEIETITNDKQNLKVCINRHRAGKVAVVIKDFIGTTEDLKILSKTIKSKCGVGGSAKNGEIIIQGDIRDKVMEILKKEGYNYKRVGGEIVSAQSGSRTRTSIGHMTLNHACLPISAPGQKNYNNL